MKIKKQILAFLISALVIFTPVAESQNVSRMNAGINVQSGTNYAVTCADSVKLLQLNNASAQTPTMPSAASCGAGVVFQIQNIGAGTQTITPTSSTISYWSGSTYVSGAASMPLPLGHGVEIFSDGSNYTAYLHPEGSRAGFISITDLAPVSGDSGLILVLDPPAAIHLTRVYGSVQGSTNVVLNLDKRTEAAIGTDTGNHLLGADLTAVTGGANTTTFANGASQCGGTSSCAIAAHAPVVLTFTSVSGTPTSLTVSVEYTVD
jgi:hypothetical protein